eukprot:491602-Prymnesium_polylepis.1
MQCGAEGDVGGVGSGRGEAQEEVGGWGCGRGQTGEVRAVQAKAASAGAARSRAVATGALMMTAGANHRWRRRRWPFSVIKAGAPNAHLDQQCVGVREEGQGRRGREGGRVCSDVRAIRC